MSKLAINGGAKAIEKDFTKWPLFDAREVEAVTEVVKSGKWGHQLEDAWDNCAVKEFREAFAKFIGIKYAIPCCNGSIALEMSLRTCGIGFGDEVITTPITWVASPLCAAQVGAKPVFGDVDPNTFCLDPDTIEPLITARTKAVIPVHIGGHLADMDRIMAIAKKHNLIVIEDCAQAHGATYKGKKVGSIGDFGAFSFEISKLMTAGEGGMIVTNNENYAEKTHALINAGIDYTGHNTSTAGMPGWNARITDIQAAVLMVQLDRLEELAKKRKSNSRQLMEGLSQIDGIEVLPEQPGQANYFLFFRYTPSAFNKCSPDRFQDAVLAEGLSAWRLFPPNYRHPKFASPYDYSDANCPVAEEASQDSFMIPHPMLLGNKEETDLVIEAIVKLQKNSKEL